MDRDAPGHERRVVRHVVRIAHQQLQRVRTGGQFDNRLGLAETEVQMVAVTRYWLTEWRDRGIDQQVMMAGVLGGHAGGRHAEVARAKPYLDVRGIYRRSVERPADVDIGITRRRRTRGRCGRRRCGCGGCGCGAVAAGAGAAEEGAVPVPCATAPAARRHMAAPESPSIRSGISAILSLLPMLTERR